MQARASGESTDTGELQHFSTAAHGMLPASKPETLIAHVKKAI